MIDKVTAKIKRYPFQTGIAAGLVICLLIVGFISLFQDHGKTLAGNSEIIQQDYLRMTINDFTRNQDEQLASWRYGHLGRKASETLKLMRADSTVSPYDLVNFAKAIGKSDVINPINEFSAGAQGTPTNPHKGLSGFGKVLLIVLGLGVAAAAGLYIASVIQTKRKQQRRAEINQNRYDDEPVNMITPEKARTAAGDAPDTLFDLDSLFPSNDETTEDRNSGSLGVLPEMNTEEETDNSVTETEKDPSEKLSEIFDSAAENPEPDEILSENDEISPIVPDSDTDESEIIEDEIKNEESEPVEDDRTEIEDVPADEQENQDLRKGISYDISDYEINDEPEEQSIPEEELPFEEENQNTDENNVSSDETETDEINSILEEAGTDNSAQEDAEFKEEPDENDDAEKPLVETDMENDSEHEDELLKMIRASKTNSDEIIGKSVKTSIDDIENTDVPDEEEISEHTGQDDVQNADVLDNGNEEDEPSSEENEILIHYQSGYKIGNDMYDEVFSIDQGDTFRGECGISIGETLNNTEPKAVTAFEVWLFDKDDIHTATWYLMSDFALSNEGISHRLEQRGKCDRIRKGDLYTLETETLKVEIKVLELEYGNEMEEKNSYFTNVVFDVIAKDKGNAV